MNGGYTGVIHRCGDRPARQAAAAPAPPAARGYFAQDAADRCATLTERERDALVLLSKGIENQEAAEILGCRPDTARDYRKAIYRKLDVDSAVEAAVLAAKAGLV